MKKVLFSMVGVLLISTNFAFASECLELKNNLFIGQTDATTNGEVSKLQKFLNDDDILRGSSKGEALLTVDGIYGNNTASAVYGFQQNNDFKKVIKLLNTKTGVGPYTRNFIKNITCEVPKYDNKFAFSVKSIGTDVSPKTEIYLNGSLVATTKLSCAVNSKLNGKLSDTGISYPYAVSNIVSCYFAGAGETYGVFYDEKSPTQFVLKKKISEEGAPGISLPQFYFEKVSDVSLDGNASTSCQKISQTLWEGNVNQNSSEVLKLQNYLGPLVTKTWGVATNGDKDGVFGYYTKNWVQEFQKRNGIKPTGSVGPKTLAKINSMICTIVSNSNSVLKSDSQSTSNITGDGTIEIFGPWNGSYNYRIGYPAGQVAARIENGEEFSNLYNFISTSDNPCKDVVINGNFTFTTPVQVSFDRAKDGVANGAHEEPKAVYSVRLISVNKNTGWKASKLCLQ